MRYRPAPAQAKTASERAGQACIAQGPNGIEQRATRARSTLGSTQSNEADCPKWPKVAGELDCPVQCGVLRPRISGPRPQSQGAWSPKPGTNPTSPGHATVAARCIVSALTSLGASISLASSKRSSRGLLAPCAGEPFEQGTAHSERLEDASAQVVAEGHPGSGLEVGSGEFDAGVRVDAFRCRSGDRSVSFERQARGVGEEMGEGRPGRPGGVVEGDAAFFQGDETGEAGQQLGNGRPVEALGERPGCSYHLCARVVSGSVTRHDAGSSQPRPSRDMRGERCAQGVRSSGHRPQDEGERQYNAR